MPLTALSPDYYEFFPNMDIERLTSRLGSLPFHIATLLGVKNIIASTSLPRSRPIINSYFRLTLDDRRRMLEEVMRYCGIREEVAVAMGKAARDAFVPAGYQPYCYLNQYVPFSKNSCLSAPGVVGLMIEHLRAEPGQRILEVGIGSGYHAACISELLGNSCQIVGLETNADYAKFGQRAVKACGYLNIDIRCDSIESVNLKKFARIYMTAATRTTPPEAVVMALEEGGLLQYVRGISEEEFRSEYAGSWLRRTFQSYSAYDEGDWRSYCCLVTAQKFGETLRELTHVYDVTFVPLQGGISDYEGSFEDPFRALSDFL